MMSQAMARLAMLANLRLSLPLYLVCMSLLDKGLKGAVLATLPRLPRSPSPAEFPEPQATCNEASGLGTPTISQQGGQAAPIPPSW